jgi:catechol 2,3-dioxygenase-like lactoylglutathione lyase family enzyme
MPVKLTHVVFNSADAEASGDIVEEVLGFRVSDRTKGMVFVRCNEAHHSTAFARAGFPASTTSPLKWKIWTR